MFFADPSAAFANLRSTCRSGGRLVSVSWQTRSDNDWLVVPGAALAEHVPMPELPPPNSRGMFGLSDPDYIRGLLAGAGWNDVIVTSRHTPMLLGGGGSVDDTLTFLRSASMARTMLNDADSVTEARAMGSLRRELEARADSEGVRLGAAVWLVQATA